MKKFILPILIVLLNTNLFPVTTTHEMIKSEVDFLISKDSLGTNHNYLIIPLDMDYAQTCIDDKINIMSSTVLTEYKLRVIILLDIDEIELNIFKRKYNKTIVFLDKSKFMERYKLDLSKGILISGNEYYFIDINQVFASYSSLTGLLEDELKIGDKKTNVKLIENDSSIIIRPEKVSKTKSSINILDGISNSIFKFNLKGEHLHNFNINKDLFDNLSMLSSDDFNLLTDTFNINYSNMQTIKSFTQHNKNVYVLVHYLSELIWEDEKTVKLKFAYNILKLNSNFDIEESIFIEDVNIRPDYISFSDEKLLVMEYPNNNGILIKSEIDILNINNQVRRVDTLEVDRDYLSLIPLISYSNRNYYIKTNNKDISIKSDDFLLFINNYDKTISVFNNLLYVINYNKHMVVEEAYNFQGKLIHFSAYRNTNQLSSFTFIGNTNTYLVKSKKDRWALQEMELD